jgi:hypothetical protein
VPESQAGRGSLADGSACQNLDRQLHIACNSAASLAWGCPPAPRKRGPRTNSQYHQGRPGHHSSRAIHRQASFRSYETAIQGVVAVPCLRSARPSDLRSTDLRRWVHVQVGYNRQAMGKQSLLYYISAGIQSILSPLQELAGFCSKNKIDKCFGHGVGFLFGM